MNFTIVDVDQRSDAWRTARLGRLTGSKAEDMLSTLKSGKGEAAGRRNLRTQYVLERLTGLPQDSDFVSADMKWGMEQEPDALAWYEAITGQLVRRYGFLQHASLQAGYSPDAVIGDFVGLVEAKAPKSATHMSYLLSGQVPYEYRCQIRHGLWLTGAAFCDFVSYDPRFPPQLQLFMSRVEAKAVDLPDYDRHARAFLFEVDREEETVRGLITKREAIAV